MEIILNIETILCILSSMIFIIIKKLESLRCSIIKKLMNHGVPWSGGLYRYFKTIYTKTIKFVIIWKIIKLNPIEFDLTYLGHKASFETKFCAILSTQDHS